MNQAASGGGGSSTPASSDGLICPAAFPCKAFDLDPAAIRDGAKQLRSMGKTVEDRTNAVHTTWSGLPAHYIAPEQQQVYELMDKPKTAADTLHDKLDSAAGHIDTYADTLEGIKPRLQSLEDRAVAFEAEARAGYVEDGGQMNPKTGLTPPDKDVTWREHQPAVEKNEKLLSEYANLLAEISSAATTCATSLNGLQSGAKEEVPPAITADMIMQSPEKLPWGNPVEEDRDCDESVAHGAGNVGKGLVVGGASLIGRDPATGDWSWGNAGKAWLGMGDFVASTAIATMPTSYLAYVMPGDSAVEQYIKDRHNVAATGLGSIVGWDHQAYLQGGDGLHKWKEDGVATATESIMNIGTFFIPGAGAAGGGAKVAVNGAKTSRLAKITSLGGKATTGLADIVMPGAGFTLSKGVHAFSFPKVGGAGLKPNWGAGMVDAASPSAGGLDLPAGAGTRTGPSGAVAPDSPTGLGSGGSARTTIDDGPPVGARGGRDAPLTSPARSTSTGDGPSTPDTPAGGASPRTRPDGAAPEVVTAGAAERVEAATPSDRAPASAAPEGTLSTRTTRGGDDALAPGPEGAPVVKESGEPAPAVASSERGASAVDTPRVRDDAPVNSAMPERAESTVGDGPPSGSGEGAPGNQPEAVPSQGENGTTGAPLPKEGTAPTVHRPGTYVPAGPDNPPRETVSAIGHRDFTPDDVQRVLDETPQNEHGQPVDHRTGRPLLLEDARGNRGWAMRWDPEANDWVAENRGLHESGMPAKGVPNSFGYDANGDLLPYANHRPSYAEGQVEQVWNDSWEFQQSEIEQGRLALPKPESKNEMWVRVGDNAEGDGLVNLGDEGTWRLVEWEPGSPRDGKWDMGHVADAKYSDLRSDYLSGRITKEQFLDEYRDPDNYSVEDPSRNRSHVDE